MEYLKIFIENENIFINLIPGEHIVKAVRRVNQTHSMNGCNGGGCGICRIKVIDGQFTTKKMSSLHVPMKDQEKGYFLGCRVFPKTDMVIQYVGLK